jgi:UDP-N-acetylglucosamine:LPS N-acetylglucosamine transferase
VTSGPRAGVATTDDAGAGPASRIGLVGSSGGHLAHLVALRDVWHDADRFWVTFDTPDATSRLVGERTYWCHHPTNRNVPNLVRNTFLALRVIRRERPTLILTTGAGAAIPYLVLGRLSGARVVFLEVYDRIDSPTITGRIADRFAHHLFVQWPEQVRLYRRATLLGPVF